PSSASGSTWLTSAAASDGTCSSRTPPRRITRFRAASSARSPNGSRASVSSRWTSSRTPAIARRRRRASPTGWWRRRRASASASGSRSEAEAAPMPLTVTPAIDDRTYQDILDDLRARIPVHNPEWTNFNRSDPGITLVELFAFLAENVFYRANQIPDRNRRKFLSLLGV